MMPARPFSDRVRADTHLRELAPGNLELVGGRHVGHRAAGGEVGQHDFLMRRAENVGALRHEVDAAEDDELGVVPLLAAARDSFSESPVKSANLMTSSR